MALSLYSLTGTPRNAMEHGKGKREMHHFAPVIESINTSPLPCPVVLRGVALAI